MPTGQGIVLVLALSDGRSRCLPTWGAPATTFGAAALAVARALAVTREINTGSHHY